MAKTSMRGRIRELESQVRRLGGDPDNPHAIQKRRYTEAEVRAIAEQERQRLIETVTQAEQESLIPYMRCASDIRSIIDSTHDLVIAVSDRRVLREALKGRDMALTMAFANLVRIADQIFDDPSFLDRYSALCGECMRGIQRLLNGPERGGDNGEALRLHFRIHGGKYARELAERLDRIDRGGAPSKNAIHYEVWQRWQALQERNGKRHKAWQEVLILRQDYKAKREREGLNAVEQAALDWLNEATNESARWRRRDVFKKFGAK